MNYEQLITEANLSFASGNFKQSLEKAKVAIQSEPKQAEGYYCAGKACMSMDQPLEAVGYFKKATEIEKTNGNGYFLLGYAQIMSEDTVGAIKSLTRALETNCDAVLKGQIYKKI